MMGVAEGKKWPGTAAETKFAEYLVSTAGGHFVTVFRRGVGEMLGVRVPGQTFVVQELMATASSEIDRLQRENAALREDRYKLACAITGGEDAPGLLDSTPTSEIVEIAQHAHRMHQGDIDRAMAAEAEVKRLQAELALSKPLYSRRQIEARVKSLEEALKPVAEKYDSITPDVADVAEGLATHPDNMQDEQIALITLRIGDLRRARDTLASTGGEHHAE